MNKKDVIFEIVGLYDRIAQLEEENKILKIQSGLGKLSGDGTTALDEDAAEEKEESPKQILLKKIKEDYFKNHFNYHLNRYSIIIASGDKEGTARTYKTFEQWYAGIGVDELLSYDTELLKTVSLKDIKKFFIQQLKQYYAAAIEEDKKELEEN